MGTNYYWHAEPLPAPIPACSTSGHQPEDDAPRGLHIGKSSMGWCFALHVIPDEGINTLADWTERFNRDGSEIYDEYGSLIDKTEILDIITKRGRSERDWGTLGSGWNHYTSEADFHRLNYSERGPNGLLRHALTTPSHVGHGDGTYDYITGEFS